MRAASQTLKREDLESSVEGPQYPREVPKYSAHTFKKKSGRYALLTAVKNEGSRLSNQLKELQGLKAVEGFDLIISDAPSTDGSTDPEVLRKLGVRALIVLDEPGRLSSSWRAGLSFALDEGYDGVVTMDGNGKDDAEALPRFATELANGYDYVQGSRFLKGGKEINTPLSRLLLIQLVHAPWMSVICRKRFSDTTNGFRAFSRKFLADPKANIFQHRFKDYEIVFYMAWAACYFGFKTKEIPVIRAYPTDGSVPTKIKGFRRRWEMLKPLVMLTLRLWK